MSASKPTSGPWAVFDHGFKKTGAYVKRRDATFAEGAIAIIPRSTVRPFEANARLIASAPELLDALKDALEFGTNMPPCVKVKARRAIKKATGAQP